MKKNRILSLLTVFVMICMLIPMTLSAASEEVTTKDIAIDTVVGIGLMSLDNDGNFLPDVQLTRGELATIISTMFNTGDSSLVEWKEKFFKELDEEFETADSFESTVELFTDVDDTSGYYAAIKTVSELGIMTGYTDGSFGPEGQLTYEQAIKVMITMLGYKARADIYGGFPNGYIRMASELKLLNGLSATTGIITKGEMAVLIFNTLDVRMLDITSIGDDIKYSAEGTDTFLERFLGMKKLTGRITDNGYSTFSGSQVAVKDFMTIGGINVRTSEDKAYARGYLGRTVNAYVEDNDGDYSLVYAGLDGLDTVTTISAKDYVGYETGKITYKVGESEKIVTFVNTPYMIYNGTGDKINASVFEFSNGTISVVTPKGASKADMIIVEAYESYYVDYVDYDGKAIFSKKIVNGQPASDKVDLDRDESYYLIVKKADGTPTDITEVANETVVSVAEGKNSMTVVISNTKVQGFAVNEIYETEGITYVSNGSTKYPLAEKFDSTSISVGESYTLYADAFGEAVYFALSNDAANKYTIAILIDYIESSGFDSVVSVKIIDSAGTVAIYNIEEKLNISGHPDINLSNNYIDSYKITSSDFKSLVTANEYHGIVRFTLNAEGKIDYLEFPVKQSAFGNPDNRLTEIYLPDTTGLTSDTNPYRDLFFNDEGTKISGWQYMNSQGFSGRILVNSSSKVFICPKNDGESDYETRVKDEDNYSITTASENFSEGKYVVKGYTTVADSKFGQYILDYKDSAKSTINHKTYKFYVFNRSYKGIDADGDPCTYVSFYSGVKENSLILADGKDLEDVLHSIMDTDSTTENDSKLSVADPGFVIEKGDIFRYALDSDGKIEKLEIIVDENAYNPASQYSNNVGNLYGTAGKWVHDDYAGGKTNPYVVYTQNEKNNFPSNGSWWSDNYQGRMRNSLYWPVYTRGTNEMCLTNQPLGVAGEVYEPDEKGGEQDAEFLTDSYVLANINAITIGANGVTVKSIPVSQLKTYEMAGNNCDRVFYSGYIGTTRAAYAYINYSSN